MKGLRTTTISILALGLLAGSAVGVAAQDEAEVPTGASYFTGTIGASDVTGEPTEAVVDGVLEVRGLMREGPIEATDPRLTGSLSRVLDFDVHSVGDLEDVVLFSAPHRIENDAGSWSGTGTGVIHAGADLSAEEELDFYTVVLTGEGAYEGLSAFLLADFAPEVGADIKGAVFPGEMPEPLPAE